ncbi:MAG: HupE/UreJ family protein [Burkholderiaceae bacterium]|nr:HupE/UreJ family protein [Burkholderiaceae bacterium]
MSSAALRITGRIVCASALSLIAFNACAHSTSTAYLEVDAATHGTPALQWRVALRDLDALLNLDANGDAQLTWGEVADRSADINALAVSALSVTRGTQACALRFAAPQYVRLADVGYAQLDATAACGGGDKLTLDYRLFENVDPSHRVLISVRGAPPRIVAPGAQVELSSAARVSDSAADSAADVPSGFSGFVSSGIAHIAGGFDHVLFLLCLLLPAVLQRQRAGQTDRWIPRDNTQGALVAVIWIATAFTVAHSITLALATFGVIRIPARVIEPLIALTIVATALNNVWPVVTRRLAAVAFAFGLIHGFGFAEVLAPLSLPRAELAGALLGFNLGVEIGQIAIVAGAFVVLASLRRWSGYPRWILRLGSIVIAIVATLWFIERVFDLEILGF